MPTSFGAGPRPQVQVSQHEAEVTKPAAHGSQREHAHRARSRMRTAPVRCVVFCILNAQTPHLLYSPMSTLSFPFQTRPCLAPCHFSTLTGTGTQGGWVSSVMRLHLARGPSCVDQTPAQVQPLTRPSPWLQRSHTEGYGFDM